MRGLPAPPAYLRCLEHFPALAIGLASNLEQLGGMPQWILLDNPEDGDAARRVPQCSTPSWCTRPPATASGHRRRPSTTRPRSTRWRRSCASEVDPIPDEGFGWPDEPNVAARTWLHEVNLRNAAAEPLRRRISGCQGSGGLGRWSRGVSQRRQRNEFMRFRGEGLIILSSGQNQHFPRCAPTM